MNNLSWMLYWADVAEKISSAVGFTFTLMCLILAGLSLFFFGFSREQRASDTERKMWRRSYLTTIPFSFVFLMVALATNLVPSKQTIYLIAASEMGEASVQQFTPELTKIRGVVNKYLDKALEKKDE